MRENACLKFKWVIKFERHIDKILEGFILRSFLDDWNKEVQINDYVRILMLISTFIFY